MYKHIYYKNGKYCISKKINGTTKYFGSYHKLTDALIERDLLVSADWDYETSVNLEENYTYIEELLPPFSRKYKYIKHINGRFYIVKSVNEKVTYFKTGFTVLEDAMKCRDYLMENNWVEV